MNDSYKASYSKVQNTCQEGRHSSIGAQRLVRKGTGLGLTRALVMCSKAADITP